MKRFTEFQKALPVLPKTYPYIGQPKINGGRCGAAFDATPGIELFDSTSGNFKLHSKEDIDLPVEHIKKELTEVTLMNHWFKDVILDGEIYQRGLKVATINGAARNKRNPVHDKLQYVVFDVINDSRQIDRITQISSLGLYFYNGLAEKHEDWPLGKVIILQSVMIRDAVEAKYYRDKYIELGFEGLILRNPTSFYTPGKHVDVMYKYKNFEIDMFKVVDIRPKPIDDHLPMFICQNDLTDATFEVIPTGTHAKQAKMLINRKQYIGLYVPVKYYERTINQLPFNANVITDEL